MTKSLNDHDPLNPNVANASMASPQERRIFNAHPSTAKRVAMQGLRLSSPTPGHGTPPTLEPGAAAFRILVQSIGGIGNTLMATPLLAELRYLYPNAQIDLLTTAGAAELLDASADISEIIVDPTAASGPQSTRNLASGLRYLRLIQFLRSRSYDAALLAHNAIDLMSSARPALARIPIRAIHAYPFRSIDDYTFLFSHIAPYGEAQHDCRGNLDLVEKVAGMKVTDRRMDLSVSPEKKKSALAKLQSLGWNENAVTIGICPGSRTWASDKRWPTNRFAAVADSLLNADDARLVLAFCGPDDREEARILRESVHHVRFHVVEGLDLLTYAAALEKCRLVISNDSLPMHMCSAMRVPVVALFGPTDPRRVGPWMGPSAVLSAKTDYTPYFTMPYICDLATGDPSMETIEVSEVIDAAEETLRKANPE